MTVKNGKIVKIVDANIKASPIQTIRHKGIARIDPDRSLHYVGSFSIDTKRGIAEKGFS